METDVSKKTRAARKAHGDVNLVGQRFGKLVVTSFAGYAKGRGQWNCKCDCGNDYVANTSALRSGNTTSCRCKVDLTGQRFGQLVVTKFAHQEKGKNSYWECLCDCGNTTVVLSTNLTGGGTKSCGHIKSLVGERFGRLVVESLAFVEVSSYWDCKCDCGNAIIVERGSLLTGNTQSCGCLWREAKVTHGERDNDLYSTWSSMKRRCENPKDKKYKDYGGRGIYVCDRWQEIRNFLEDMGPRPTKKHQLDRIDVDGPYSPDNCRWATIKENMRNKRDNRYITYNGSKKTLVEWSEETGLDARLISRRLDDGWSIKQAFLTPVGGTKSKYA